MDGTLGEIRIFTGDFAPVNWAFCQGQLLSLRQNTPLFSILGTYYGGDGRSTFALPDFRGRIPVSGGQGVGLAQYDLGAQQGSENFTVLPANVPSHTHVLVGSVTMSAAAADGDSDSPQNTFPASQTGKKMYVSTKDTSVLPNMQHNLGTAVIGSLNPDSVSNMQPVLALNYIICVAGDFPQRP